MKILVNLPTYNERDNLAKLVDEILKNAPHVDVLIIDDSSPDGTGEIADKLALRHVGRVKVIHRQGKLGLGTAIMRGFEYAFANNYDFVINMDCDFSHDPKELPAMIAAAGSADLVIASRHLPGSKVVGWNWLRHLLHWGSKLYTNIVLGGYVSEHTNSYKAYRVEVLKKLPLNDLMKAGGGFVWHTLLVYMVYKKGYRIKEVPTTFVYRTAGASKMSMKEMLSGMWAILKYRISWLWGQA